LGIPIRIVENAICEGHQVCIRRRDRNKRKNDPGRNSVNGSSKQSFHDDTRIQMVVEIVRQFAEKLMIQAEPISKHKIPIDVKLDAQNVEFKNLRSAVTHGKSRSPMNDQ